MVSSTGRRRVGYPFSEVGVYISAMVAALSIILALLVLREPVLLVSYFVVTSILTLTVIAVKSRFLFARKSQSSRNSLEKRGSQKWRMMLLAFCFIVALVSPVLLLPVLSPASWFVGLDSYVSGVSLSEVILFFHSRRNFKRRN